MTFMTMFTVYGEPVGKGRPRFAKRGNFVSTYTPQKTKTYEDEIRMMASAAMGSSEPLDTPVTVAIYIRVGIPASFSKQKRKDALEGLVHLIFSCPSTVVCVDESGAIEVPRSTCRCRLGSAC